jgi:glyoxylase-like metal-dependent hydrolase (beta-lactamase superfamily II)
VAYQVGDAIFVGDTLFMPDVGSARCDFPGGDAKTLYASTRKLLSLPAQTRLFMCHDYPPNSRPVAYETTVAEQPAAVIIATAPASAASPIAFRIILPPNATASRRGRMCLARQGDFASKPPTGLVVCEGQAKLG